MAEYQGALAVIAEIKSDAQGQGRYRAKLEERLAKIDRQVVAGSTTSAQGALLPLGDMSAIHYARFVITPAAKGIRSSLVLSTNYDEPRREHLRELAAEGGAELDAIFAHCVGYPAGAAQRDVDAFIRFIDQHAHSYGAFHIAKRFYSVQEIRREEQLRVAIGVFLDENGPWQGRDVVQEVRDFVAGDEQLAWAVQEPPPEPGEGWARRHGLFSARALAALTALVPVAAVALPVLLAHEAVDNRRLQIQRMNESDARRRRWEITRVKRFADLEDRTVANQLSLVSDMKPGPFRSLLSRAAFYAVDRLANMIYFRGELGGIPTIHFARWLYADKGKRLLFFSNYDGSWESYLGDFVDQNSAGLTALWSNTKNYPRTWLLVLAGSRDEQAFKRWARDQQVKTEVFYAAYPDLSVTNIIDNARIRRGLHHLDEADRDKWLALL